MQQWSSIWIPTLQAVLPPYIASWRNGHISVADSRSVEHTCTEARAAPMSNMPTPAPSAAPMRACLRSWTASLAGCGRSTGWQWRDSATMASSCPLGRWTPTTTCLTRRCSRRGRAACGGTARPRGTPGTTWGVGGGGLGAAAARFTTGAPTSVGWLREGPHACLRLAEPVPPTALRAGLNACVRGWFMLCGCWRLGLRGCQCRTGAAAGRWDSPLHSPPPAHSSFRPQ